MQLFIYNTNDIPPATLNNTASDHPITPHNSISLNVLSAALLLLDALAEEEEPTPADIVDEALPDPPVLLEEEKMLT
jgi:hypothetical protein